MTRLAQLSVGIILLICLVSAFWYIEAGNFSDANVPGTYIAEQRDETSTLILRPDHTFQQELDSAGTVRRAHGRWSFFPSDSKGHIEFSKEFIVLSGQELNPDGTAFGQLENRFGLLSISIAPTPGGPTFRKRLLY
jgi:hypothetical protein